MERPDAGRPAALIHLTLERAFPALDYSSFWSPKVLFTTPERSYWCRWYSKIQTP